MLREEKHVNNETLDALEYLFGKTPDGELWVGGFWPTTRGERFTDLSAAAVYAENMGKAGVQGIYVRNTALPIGWRSSNSGGRGASTDSSMLYFLAADVDIRGPGHVSNEYPPDEITARAMVACAGLPPTSGYIHSGGGLYPLWKLAKPFALAGKEELERAARLTQGWYARLKEVAGFDGYKIDNTSDLSRVYRLPGTYNRKPDWGDC